MNDPDSYEHVQTKFLDKGSYIYVITKYRGKNGYGAVMTESISAKVDTNGNVLEIISHN